MRCRLRQDLRFGIFITPAAAHWQAVLELARLADVIGLDLVTSQGQPYQARFLETWTLLSVVCAQTANVKVAPNVANLPLRPPIVLARSVASLDLISAWPRGARARSRRVLGWDRGGRGPAPDGESERGCARGGDRCDRAVWSAEGGRSATRVSITASSAPSRPGSAHAVEIWLGPTAAMLA